MKITTPKYVERGKNSYNTRYQLWPKNNPLNKLKNKEFRNISIYAQNKDYHKIIKGKLKNLASWIVSKTQGEVKGFCRYRTFDGKTFSGSCWFRMARKTHKFSKF